MHLITIRNLRQDATPYPDVQKQLNDWNDIVKDAEWQSLIDVQIIYKLVVKLIEDYESIHYNLDDWEKSTPDELLRIMASSGTRNVDLIGIIGSSGVVSEVGISPLYRVKCSLSYILPSSSSWTFT